MDWKNTAVAAVVSLLFLLQGISAWRRSGISGYGRSLGVLTVLLAILGFSSHFLLASGAMVFALEYGILMVQGTAAWTALVIVLMGLPISAAMGVYVSRSFAGRPPRWAWPVIVGALLGGLAVSRVQQLDNGIDLLAPIRAYDIWWPALPIWFGLCFVESVFSIEQLHRRSVKLVAATALGLGFSFWAVSRDRHLLQYADPQSAPLWRLTLYLGLPTLMGAAAWVAFKAWPRLERLGRWPRLVAVTLAAIAGLASNVMWINGSDLPLVFHPVSLWIAVSAISVVIAVLSVGRLLKMKALRIPDFGQMGRWDDAVGVGALVAIAVGLADGLYLRRGTAVLDLVLVLVGWATFVEVITVGPFSEFVNRPLKHSLQKARQILERDSTRVREFATTSLTAFAKGVKAFFTFESLGVGALRLVMLAALLVAIAELPHAGKTVIVPFTELGLSDEEAKHFGRMISNRVVNRFATLARELEPEVAILRPSSDKRGQSLNLVASGDAADRPEAVVSGDLEIGTVKIPISLITSWIQTPMRALLDVRVVTGSVQKEGNGYLLLAQSSDGGVFRVQVSRPSADSFDRTLAADDLADELAYKLISTLPEMADAGMTQSWQAVEPYSNGLAKWKQFATARDYDALTESIVEFRKAVQLDPDFALAHHRLGLALTSDNQPFVATDALRSSLQANPKFALGYHALASHLYFNRSESLLPSQTPAFVSVSQDAADKLQAQMLWYQVLRFPPGQVPVLAQADAHAGLCRMIFETPAEDEASKPRAEFIRYYIAFFHCHRALQLFATLPPTVRDSLDVRTAEGWAWLMAGWILNESGKQDVALAEPTWLCSKEGLEVDESGKIEKRTLGQSPYTEDAVSYYDRASALLPEDNTILCARAEAAFVANRHQPMRAMAMSSEAHRLLAESLVDPDDPGRMKLALQEFRTAFTLDPQNLFARNGYSYAVWKWYLRGGPSSLTDMPTDAVYDAERHARDAARLGVGAADRSDAAAMRSTLGEVLMMQGRWHEAYRELEEAVKLAPKHSFFDEIRWELGLAYLCTGTIDRRPGRSTKAELDFEAAATRWFATIRTSDQGREIPSLTGDQPLEWHTAAAMCANDAGRNWSGDELEAMPYELQRSVPRTDAYAPCNQLAVTALVSSATVEEAEGIHLRVIGPELGAGGRRVAPGQVLTLPRLDSHDLYFAQLLRDDDTPASTVLAITTQAKASCENNRIVLEFGTRGAKPTVKGKTAAAPR